MLETRTVSGTIHKTSGEVWPFAEVTFKLRRDAAGDGIVIPQFPEVITADEDGVFECELYTITDGFLPYRCTLPNGKGFKFDLPPGNEITLDVLLDLGELDDSESVQAAFINALTLALIWENITGKPLTFPPATHTHSGLETSITNLSNAVVDLEDAIDGLDSEKQDLSEKGQPDGYVGLDGDGFIDRTITRWDTNVSTANDLVAMRIISRPWLSKPITVNRNIVVNKDEGYSNIRLNSRDGDPIFDAIWSETGGNFIDGDEILIFNVLGEPVLISPDGPTGDGIAIYTNQFATAMLWPTDQAVKFVKDDDIGRFRAIPMFSLVEMSFGQIDGHFDVGGSTYQQLHGKLNRVTDGYTITFYSDVPNGFRADFEADTSNDVTFAVDGDTIRNRQAHTKIAGQYGVVTVYKRAGSFYLVGDTKA